MGVYDFICSGGVEMKEDVFTRKVRDLGRVLGISIPKSTVEKLGLKEGDWVKVVITKIEG